MAQKAGQVPVVASTSLLQVQNGIGTHRRHLVDTVLDHDGRTAGVDVLADREEYRRGGIGIHAGQRFVDDDQSRTHDEHPGQRHQLQLSTGQFVRVCRQERLVDAQLRDDTVDPRTNHVGGQRPVLQTERDVGQHRVRNHLTARIL